MDIDRIREELNRVAKNSSEPSVLQSCTTLLALPPVQAVAGDQDDAIQLVALKKLLQAVADASSDSDVHVKMAVALMFTHPGPWTKESRRQAAADVPDATWGARSIRRNQDRLLDAYLGALIEFLGNRRAVDAFVQEARRSLGLASGTTRRAALGDYYVHRDEYERRFKELVTDGAKLIALVGQPGMGKTWLADSLMRQYQASESTTARITMQPDGSPSLGDLYEALNACGLPVGSLAAGDPRFHLHRLTRDEEHAPRFVVLDNVEDTALLNSLLPRETKSIVVVTTRLKTRPPQQCRILDIGPMTDNEGRALIQRLLPDLAGEESDRLSQVLHGFPLVIVFACRLLARKRLSVPEFCDALTQTPRAILSKVPVGATENLVSVLADIADLLAEQDEAAFNLLECAVLVGTLGKVPHCFLKRYLSVQDASATKGITVTTAATYALAVESLLDFCLFEEVDGDYLAMHPLTRDILHELPSGGIARVAAQVTVCVRTSAPKRYKEEIAHLEFRDDAYFFEHPIFYEAIDIWRLFASFKDTIGGEPAEMTHKLISFVESAISMAAAAAFEKLADQSTAKMAESASTASGQALLDEFKSSELYRASGRIFDEKFGDHLDLSDPRSIEMLQTLTQAIRLSRSMRFSREGIARDSPAIEILMDMIEAGTKLLYKTSDNSTSGPL
jgi:hypothetical protein